MLKRPIGWSAPAFFAGQRRGRAMLTERAPRHGCDIAAQLRTEGFCVVRAAVPTDIALSLEADLASAFAQTPFCKGAFYGERTQRFGRLLLRTPKAAPFVLHPQIFGAAEEILAPWCDTLQLNLTQGLAVHPGAPAQFPHRDQDMWRGMTGEVEYLVNVMWPFTPYTSQNGATRIWPRSHGAQALAAEPAYEPIAIEMDVGDALVFLGSTLHGAGGNASARPRRGMIISYCLGWLKPYENQWLAYPPPIAREFSPELAALVGYRQHRPNLGNFEGLCPSILLGPDAHALPGAADALTPDQTAALAAWVAAQRDIG
jgi:ectoine hydroxylase-related dioxygenase (phytanoyl-CoA dioxygenase family)